MINAALIGAGNRGNDVYGAYALEHPDGIRFVALAEPDPERRNRFAALHQLPEDKQFISWQDLLAKPKLGDLIFICSQDRMHYEPTIAALRKGYDILLEKPMAAELKECADIVKEAKLHNRNLTVAHVLRYTPFFSKVKEVLSSGMIGNIIEIHLHENVGYWHYTHSYVRGNWANSETAVPMILAKSCHDMDLLVWLSEKKPLRLASFGSLKFFRRENAPEGSAARCLDCKLRYECLYSAVKQYLGQNTDWPVNVISCDLSFAGRLKALKEGPYGRCVFRCNNSVVDHQVVSIEFEGGITASFSMSGFTHDISREIKIMGTLGVIEGKLESNQIEIHQFGNGCREVIHIPQCPGRHSGGDYGLMEHLLRQYHNEGIEDLTSAEGSLMSHIMAFAAEESRLTGKVVDIEEFSIKSGIKG